MKKINKMSIKIFVSWPFIMDSRILSHFRKLISNPSKNSIVECIHDATHILAINSVPHSLLLSDRKQEFERKMLLTCMEPYCFPQHDLRPAFTHVRSRFDPNMIEWHLSPSHTDFLINKVDLTKRHEDTMSVCFSTKYSDPGHVKRIELVKQLDACSEFYVHVYGDLHEGHDGWIPKHPMKKLVAHEKDQSLFPYKYTMHAENFVVNGYVTEKFWDAILSETLIFYSGDVATLRAMGIHDLAYVDITNMSCQNATNLIKLLIEHDEYERRVPYIRDAKRLILGKGGIDRFVQSHV